MLLCVSLIADNATSILAAVCLFCAATATALAAAAVDAMMQAMLVSSNDCCCLSLPPPASLSWKLVDACSAHQHMDFLSIAVAAFNVASIRTFFAALALLSHS